MSVETDYLAKLLFIENTCNGLIAEEFIAEGQPTIYWILDQVNDIKIAICKSTNSPKQKLSWMRTADRKMDQVRTLMSDTSFTRKVTNGKKRGDVYLLTTLTLLLADMEQSKKFGHLINPLVEAACLLEKYVDMRNVEPVIDLGIEFIERIYGKMDAV